MLSNRVRNYWTSSSRNDGYDEKAEGKRHCRVKKDFVTCSNLSTRKVTVYTFHQQYNFILVVTSSPHLMKGEASIVPSPSWDPFLHLI